MKKAISIICRSAKATAFAAGVSMISAASLFMGPFIATPAHAAETWQANDDDSLLFDIRSGKYRLGDGVRGYQTATGVCVDLADVIIALDLPVRLDKKSRRATGWIFSENQTLTIERDSNTVQKVNERKKLKQSDIYDTPEGWCVNVKSLENWLDVSLQADLSNALLVLKSDTKLPFQSALERKERAAKIRPRRSFDLSSLPQSTEPYKLWRTPSVDAVVSAGGLRDNRSGQQFDLRYELFASGEVGKASFDARLSSTDKGIPQNLRVRAYRTDPKGQLLGPLKATHFALGDVSTVSTPLVSQSTVGRGGFVTNRPVDRPDSFDRTSFRGELPEGWEAELYRNGQLLAFAETRTDGRYEFIDVPLLYGQNNFEVVLYGPQGQVKRDNKTVPVGLDSIPPKQTYYWAGVHEAGEDLIRLSGFSSSRQAGWRGGIGFERGLNAKTSVAASLFSLQIDGNRYNYLEGSLRRAVGPTLVELSASSNLIGGTALRGQLLGALGDTQITAETIWARGGFTSDRIEQKVNGRHGLSVDHNFTLGEKIVPFHIDAQYETQTDGNNSLDLRARTSFNLRRFSVTGELIWGKRFSAFGPDPPDQITGRILVNGRIGKVRLRGEASYRIAPEKRFERVNFTGEWGAGERSNWRAELGYDVPFNRARAGIGYVRRFDKFSLTASAEAATDGSVAAGLNLAFSLGPDPRNGKFRFSSNKLANNGQALAIVFRDKNRDGIRQPNEPLEENVEITAGQSTALTPTDKNGRSVVDNLQPFRPVLIGIDTGSLPDPYVQPSLPGVVITPRPGIAMTVELPLVAAGEVEGTLVRQGGGAISGVGLELLDGEGRVVRETRTEFDGFFLFEGVPYGEYRVRIDQLSAQATKLSPQLAGRAIVDDQNPIARLGAVTVSGLRTLAAADSTDQIP
ncbi:MSCRAMM family protein [Parasphingorhabdus halotolerans]|uniref:Carboxypeptidase regulatory-like domain-containing protein n=1 Tax=Parasphingorhabdus halotolerans TaxID=2725558 RepID=A0A6H2DNG4_9SPHN|nr:carboxypeptidase-like regulatory domain-containing protein [Parasphingorhabdus halotolerans]QJB69677.1 carboxypeptidase regulatory-like domain-containing protein [Parasphingorhabdus halotolerans]